MSKPTPFERIVQRIIHVAGYWKTSCWVWPGSICNKGYGMVRVEGKTRRVHIVLWEIINGRRVREGYTLDHLCRNKKCFRPTHMEEVTRSENTARGNRANPRSTEAARAAAARKRCQ